MKVSRPLCTAKGSLFSYQLGNSWSANPWPHFPYSDNFIGRILLKICLSQGVFSQCWFSLQSLLRKSLIPPFRSVIKKYALFWDVSKWLLKWSCYREQWAKTDINLTLRDRPFQFCSCGCRAWKSLVCTTRCMSCLYFTAQLAASSEVINVESNSTRLETIHVWWNLPTAFCVEIKGDISQCHVLKWDIVPQTKPLLAAIPPMLAEHPGL